MASVLSKSKILEYTGGSLKGEDVLAASKKYGFTADDYDSAFGSAPGTAQAWIDKNVPKQTGVLSAVAPNNAATTPTPAPSPTPQTTSIKAPAVTATPTPTPAATPIAATSQPVTWNNDTIKSTSEKVGGGFELLSAINRGQMNIDQVRGALGKDAVDDWLAKNGLSALFNTAATPRPQPGALTPTAVDQTNPVSSFSGYSPNTIAVDPAKSTVQGQLKEILDSGSPIMDLARTKAMQTANRRGLLNSTMAAGAGERAAIETAFPIASQDASTYHTTQRDNQAATNRANEFSADATNQGARTAADINLQTDRNAHDIALQKLRGEQQVASDASINQNNRVVSFNNAVGMITSNTATIIANLRADSSLDPATRAQLISDVQRDADAQINRLGVYNDIDTGALLNFNNTPAADATNLSDARTSANAAAATEEDAIRSVYNAAAARGLTLEKAAQELGMTPEKAASKLAQIGASLPSAP